MTIEQLCCVSFGVVVQAMTFALGIVIGASLRRKDSAHVADERQGATGSDPAR